MPGPQVVVKFLADTSQMQQQMQQVEGSGSRLTRGLGGVATAVSGAFVTTAVVNFGQASFAAAEEAAAAQDRLRAVFKASGEATDEAANSALAYAEALSKKIGVDDEVIAGAQAQLATFHNVSDAAARQAGVFDQATVAAADLAAAGFGSMDSASVMLGKALNDPIAGITALQRAGVQFTDAQKEQIAAMVESGDVLGAQQIILAEVQSQVGGTAEATATGTQKMSVAFGELQEEIGAGLMPVMASLMPLLEGVMGFIGRYAAIIVPVVAAFALWTAAVSVATTVQTAFGVSLGISVGWIALIVVAVAALAAGVVYAYQNFEWFRTAVDAVWQMLQAVFNWIVSNWQLLAILLGGPIGLAVVLIVEHFNTLRNAVEAVGAFIGAALEWIGAAWNRMADVVSGVVSRVGGYLSTIASIFGVVKDAASAATQWVIDRFQAMASFISGIVATISGAVSGIVNAIKGPINALIGGWNRLSFTVPTITLPKVSIPGVGDIGGGSFGGQRFDFPNIPLLHSGGIVPGRVGQDVLALLQAGERVLPADARSGPAVQIGQVVVQDPVDLDLFTGRLNAAIAARGSGW